MIMAHEYGMNGRHVCGGGMLKRNNERNTAFLFTPKCLSLPPPNWYMLLFILFHVQIDYSLYSFILFYHLN